MSISSEITRIANNVQNTIDTIGATGVTVPEGANSNNLPSLAAALANEKQDKLTGTQGQVVGFDAEGNAVAQDAPDTGVTTFNGRTGAVTPQNGDYTAEMVGARPSTWTPSAEDVGAVPTSRTVNGKALSENISLTANDVGARPNTWMPTASDVGAVPTSRTVNGKALSQNISLTAGDVGARPDTWMPSAEDVGALTQDDILTFGAKSVAASVWAADTTYEGWGFRAEVPLSGVTADYVPSVTFGIADATSGNLAPVADTYAGGVYIYAKEQPAAAVSVVSVVCVKGV